MYLKRLISIIIDMTISFIPAIILSNYLYQKYSVNMKFSILFFSFNYLILGFIFVKVYKCNSIGIFYFNIRLKYENLKKLIYQHLFISFFLIAIAINFINQNNLLFIMNVLSLLIFLMPEKFSFDSRLLLDNIFKIEVIKKHREKE